MEACQAATVPLPTPRVPTFETLVLNAETPTRYIIRKYCAKNAHVPHWAMLDVYVYVQCAFSIANVRCAMRHFRNMHMRMWRSEVYSQVGGYFPGYIVQSPESGPILQGCVVWLTMAQSRVMEHEVQGRVPDLVMILYVVHFTNSS